MFYASGGDGRSLLCSTNTETVQKFDTYESKHFTFESVLGVLLVAAAMRVEEVEERERRAYVACKEEARER